MLMYQKQMNKTFRNVNVLRSGFLGNKILKKKDTKALFSKLGLEQKIEAVSYWIVIDEDLERVCEGFNVFRRGKEDEKKLVTICKLKFCDDTYTLDDDKEYESSPIFDEMFELLRKEVVTK